MKLINKFLRLFNLTWVIRYRNNLSTDLKFLSVLEKKLLIFNYNSPKEKVIFETIFRIKS
jgi:hypothetical protein